MTLNLLQTEFDIPFKLGEYIFQKIIEKIAISLSKVVGLKVIYLFAANEKLVEYYKTWGFKEIENPDYNNQLNSTWLNEYSQDCIFLYKPVS